MLHGISDLLFGDPEHVFSEGHNEKRLVTSNSFPWKNLTQAVFFDDLQQETDELFNRGSFERQPPAIAHVNCKVDVTVDAMQRISPALTVLAADQPVHYLDQQGRLVDAATVLSCWQQRLRALAQSTHGSRLLILEAHAAPSQPIDRQREDAEFLHCDWIRRLAREYPIGAEAFITLAASAGLFNGDCVKRYPRTADPCRISLHSFTKRDYIIRHATETDLERLCQLEQLCWQHTRTPRKQIRARLKKYPQGQFVLEKEGKVLGVIYSQRIAATDALVMRNAANVHRLHQGSGPVIQLLAVNIDPQAQNFSYGDQLLEFMLQRCGLITGVKQVVGVTLCKNYNAEGTQSFEEYIQRQGSTQDPVLAFHQAHGAGIVRAIAGYRPQDHANRGNGVLVAYDILNRTSRHQRIKAEATVAMTTDAMITTIDQQQISQFVQGEAAQLLGVSESECDIDRPVMEMGLDSADLLKLQQRCEDRFGLEFQAGFFFEYNSIRKVAECLTARLTPAPEADRARQVASVNAAQCSSNVTLPTRGGTPHKEHAATTDIAIIGMSCKLPGSIETPDQLWQLLVSSKCVIDSFPIVRGAWPTGADYPGIDQGGFVKDVDAFDAAFFRTSAVEAQVTDPQQRMLLELAWSCLEDAGFLPAVLKLEYRGFRRRQQF